MDELRQLHAARGGTAWHPDYLPRADLSEVWNEMAAMAKRLQCLETQQPLQVGTYIVEIRRQIPS